MTATDSNIKIREDYEALGLTDGSTHDDRTRKSTPDGRSACSLDQFHTRGILAAAESSGTAGLDAFTRVLDLSSGIGGPARYLAASSGFIDAATYLTACSGMSDSRHVPGW